MKIAVNAGHTAKGKSYGAVGYLRESEETRKVVNELIPLLKQKGHQVINATIDISPNYLSEVVNISNTSKADLLISIHFNAGGGYGCEVFTWRGKKLLKASKICNNLKWLGFRNRGVKDGSEFYIIRKTKAQALLVEVCFVDSLLDTTLYKNVGVKKIAKAIADAI